MKQRLTLFIALATLAFSCQKETETPPGTTPYTFEEARLGRLGKPLVPKENPMTVEGVELGRILFYDKKLSADNSLACGTCHQQKYAFSDGGQAFSLGVGGAIGKHNAMSLTNVAWDKHFNWNGSAKSLEEQAQIPMESPIEMHQKLDRAINKLQNTPQYPPLFLKAFGSKVITGENILKAIGQFERTLISSNSKYDRVAKYEDVFRPDEQRGFNLFKEHPNAQDPLSGTQLVRGGNCNDCHTVGHFTDHSLRNNGLDDTFNDNGLGGFTGKAEDIGKFKIPTLRNIALTAPYMHDGRFKSLEDVLNHYNEHVKKSLTLDPLMSASNNKGPNQQLGLTDQEKRDIIAFLKTLTDSSFVTDPSFSDPFKK